MFFNVLKSVEVYSFKNSAGDKKKRAIISDSDSEGGEGSNKNEKRKKESDSDSDISSNPKRKTKKLHDFDDETKDDNGIVFFYYLTVQYKTVSSTGYKITNIATLKKTN